MDKSEILTRAKAYIKAEKDERFRKEVEDLIAKNDMKELEDRFYRTLEFGTGGLRGIMGGGTNRMNTLEINLATQGLANYVISASPEKAKKAGIKEFLMKPLVRAELATAVRSVLDGKKDE